MCPEEDYVFVYKDKNRSDIQKNIDIWPRFVRVYIINFCHKSPQYSVYYYSNTL